MDRTENGNAGGLRAGNGTVGESQTPRSVNPERAEPDAGDGHGGKPRDPRRILGSCAEDVAAGLLLEAGYTVLDRNWRYGMVGELDIVCRRGDLLVFVEVRSSATGYLRSPSLTVNGTKQAQVIRVARCYMARPWLRDLGCRFDVVAVEFRDGLLTRTEWIEDAFRPQSTVRAQIYQG